METLRRANYKWLVEPRACFEYWGKEQDEDEDEETDNMKFNPHIHIAVVRIDKESKIRQNLIKKFIEKKLHTVYRIDVKGLPTSRCIEYVSGTKKQSKLAQVDMDEKTRIKHQVQPIITL